MISPEHAHFLADHLHFALFSFSTTLNSSLAASLGAFPLQTDSCTGREVWGHVGRLVLPKQPTVPSTRHR